MLISISLSFQKSNPSIFIDRRVFRSVPIDNQDDESIDTRCVGFDTHTRVRYVRVDRTGGVLIIVEFQL